MMPRRRRAILNYSAAWFRLAMRASYNSSMSLRPLHDRILVRRIEEGEQIRGGIVVPDTAKEKPQQGEVIAAGSGKLLESGERATVDVKAGDKILFGKYSGSEVRLQGQDYLILREDEILAVLE
jgi:chaperonin GroES